MQVNFNLIIVILTLLLIIIIHLIKYIINMDYNNQNSINDNDNDNKISNDLVIEYIFTFGLPKTLFDSITQEVFDNLDKNNPEITSIFPKPDEKSYIYEVNNR